MDGEGRTHQGWFAASPCGRSRDARLHRVLDANGEPWMARGERTKDGLQLRRVGAHAMHDCIACLMRMASHGWRGENAPRMVCSFAVWALTRCTIASRA